MATPKKRTRCPNKTRKNKRTGNCDKLYDSDLIKSNWDDVATQVQKSHNGKTYTFIVIPQNTYVYYGFSYGDNPKQIPSQIPADEREAYQKETEHENKLDYKKFSMNNKWYGNVAVASYYACRPDRRYYSVVNEYITTKPIVLLDMSVWQNIKNVVDDVTKRMKNQKDADNIKEVFQITHGYDETNPSLKRFSIGYDEEMSHIMNKWKKRKASPSVDGFGHIRMDGLHSEFYSMIRSLFKKTNVYMLTDMYTSEMVNVKIKEDVIDLKKQSFLTNGKRFHVSSLLYQKRNTGR